MATQFPPRIRQVDDQTSTPTRSLLHQVSLRGVEPEHQKHGFIVAAACGRRRYGCPPSPFPASANTIWLPSCQTSRRRRRAVGQRVARTTRLRAVADFGPPPLPGGGPTALLETPTRGARSVSERQIQWSDRSVACAVRTRVRFV